MGVDESLLGTEDHILPLTRQRFPMRALSRGCLVNAIGAPPHFAYGIVSIDQAANEIRHGERVVIAGRVKIDTGHDLVRGTDVKTIIHGLRQSGGFLLHYRCSPGQWKNIEKYLIFTGISSP